MPVKYGFVTFVKGGIIGIGSAIPFVSLASLLVSIDLFKLAIDAICNFFKDIKGNTYILLPLILGIVIGFFSGNQIVTHFYPKYNCQIVLFVSGFIMGFIPIFSKNKNKCNKLFGSLLFIALFSLFLIFSFISNTTLNININTLSNTIFYGLVTGIAILFPGFSEYLLTKLFNITSFTSFFGDNTFTFAYIFSIILGFIFVSLLFKYLYKKPYINYILSSLMLSSIVLMLLSITTFKYNFICIFSSLLSFLWGYILSINTLRE